MLQLRVFGNSSPVGEVAKRLGALPGARHVSVVPGELGGGALLTADVRASAADGALEIARGVGIAPEDISLLEVIEAVDGPLNPSIPSSEGLPTESQSKLREALEQVTATSRSQLGQIKLSNLLIARNHS